VDSQSVPGAATVGKTSRGYDAGKKVNGRKRHLVVDTGGLLIVVLVTAASVQDRDGGVRVLDRAKMAMPSLALVWADAAYSRRCVEFAARALRLAVHHDRGWTFPREVLEALTRALGGAVPDDGLRVVGINPGPVLTERLEGLLRRRARETLGDAERWRETMAAMPFGRAGRVAEIATLAAFLASDLSGYTSGTIVTVDGGMASRCNAF